MLVEQETGWILAEHNADQRIAPASLAKIMTSYIVFEALANGTIALDDKTRISEKAWRTGGSRMFLDVDSMVSIEDLIKGLVIQSGNDAAVALAEYVAGDVDVFSQMMNKAAQKLGMENSNFTNPNGLPDPELYTTARDLMRLTTSMVRDYPQYYRWYREKEFTYNDITQKNRNPLLSQDADVDGVKTGHTKEAGYCLIGSALKDNMRLTAVVTGADSARARARAVEALLRYGFNYYEYFPVYNPGDAVAQVAVFKGETDSVAASVLEGIGMLIPKGKADQLTVQITTSKHVIAPLAANSEVGALILNYAGSPVLETVLVAPDAVNEGPIWTQLIDNVRLWWQE